MTSNDGSRPWIVKTFLSCHLQVANAIVLVGIGETLLLGGPFPSLSVSAPCPHFMFYRGRYLAENRLACLLPSFLASLLALRRSPRSILLSILFALLYCLPPSLPPCYAPTSQTSLPFLNARLVLSLHHTPYTVCHCSATF